MYKDPDYHKKRYQLKKDQIKKQVKEYRLKNKQRISDRYKRWYQVNRLKHIENVKKYNRNNPHSSSTYELEVKMGMDEARKRDGNICKWYNCGLTNKTTQIHVHHIFPQKYYPELRTLSKYMICYCKEHHKLWHKYYAKHLNTSISKTNQ